MSFHHFRTTIQSHINSLLQQPTLFVTDVDKDKLYDLYLSSFPVGTNNLYIERTEHDCSACKQFIRNFGNVVAIVDNKLISVWDVQGLNSTYTPVVAALSTYVKSVPVVNQFMYAEATISIPRNVVQLQNGEVHTWTHLYVTLQDRFIVKRGKSIEASIAETRDSKNVLLRSLSELTVDSIETVLDLISQNSLYRGQEFKPLLERFLATHNDIKDLTPNELDIYCWSAATTLPISVTRIRNSAIGTLLIDLSEGLDLDVAVRKFESVVAPSNYKRPKAIFSKRMLEDAQKTVTELGLVDSLARRFATVEDIKVQNILFANTDILRQVSEPDVFTQLRDKILANPHQFKGVEEIHIDKFLVDILPRVTTIELLLENHHSNNLVSVIAPVNTSSPSLFKWANGFSWAYTGNITDSMKQRVKDAGGAIDGVLRFSIQWNENGDNHNDFDAHCIEPSGAVIYYPNKGSRYPSSGILDVDIIHPSKNIAVENITWSNLNDMPEGVYKFQVNTFTNRGGLSGFRAEVEFDGQIYSFDYAKPTRAKELIDVAEVIYTKRNGFTIKRLIDSSVSSKVLWGKPTNQFHPISSIMLSPNYWDEQQGNGNKHYLFLLDGCINDESPNGFFNEFLRNDLIPHKRVFEALGAKMQVTSNNPKQLSGLGFSSTQRNNLICKVAGHAQRIIKITF